MPVPALPSATAAAPVERWGTSNWTTVERVHAGGGFAYDLTLEDMARHESRPIASNAARWIEYRIAQLDLGSRGWPLGMAARPVGLLALGARKPGVFHPGQGTELLTFLARTLGITIAAWLDLAA
jgi:uncharacterized protein YigA (DUF484 family)